MTMIPSPNETHICPVCGEPVKLTWRFCPACETSLLTKTCPQCKNEVKENWKRCPECGCRLVCKSCGQPLPPGDSNCPACETGTSESIPSSKTFMDTITGMVFLHVPAGRFNMGDIFNIGIENEKPIHTVQLDEFYIGKFPVTQYQWKTINPDNPSFFLGDTLPVEQVSRDDVKAFIQKLTALNHHRYIFQLPSEAQWEFAARSGGKEEMYAGGNDADRFAWFVENSDGKTHSVGQKKPNGLGIYDMSGNVWEWCLDAFAADAYRRHEAENPVCRGNLNEWVIRGGSWNIDAWSVRCTRRLGFSGEYIAPGLGFRLMMTFK